MSDSGNPAGYAFSEVQDDPTTTFITLKALEAMAKERAEFVARHPTAQVWPEVEVLPLELQGLGCGWYPEGMEGTAAVPGDYCKNEPVYIGNGVSGPGFVPFCKEHATEEFDRWGFEMWVLVRVTGALLIDLTNDFHR